MNKEIKATHYTTGEFCKKIEIPFILYKSTFLQNASNKQYNEWTNAEYSDVINGWVFNHVWLISNIKVFAIFFEDGSVWENKSSGLYHRKT